MTDEPVFLTVDQVLAIHQRMVDDFGGDPSVRDYGLLASAVMMPASKFDGAYLHADIPAMTAAYLFHLCKNHPFADGNKRTALATAEVFLNINGYDLQAEDEGLGSLTEGTAEGSVTKDELSAFFRDHVSKSDP